MSAAQEPATADAADGEASYVAWCDQLMASVRQAVDPGPGPRLWTLGGRARNGHVDPTGA